MAAAIVLHPTDTVVVATRPLRRGETVAGSLVVAEDVPAGHKVARVDHAAGEPVRKYGQTIGLATRLIPAGTHVHSHNLHADAFERDYAYASEVPPDPPAVAPRTFQGYDRGDGRFGTRNYVAVVSTVNCSAGTVRRIADAVRQSGAMEQFPNVDGIVPIIHPHGCAMQHDCDDHRQLARTLAGYARHPNVAACVVVGLGCETGQPTYLLEREALAAPPVLTVQECGGIRKTVQAGVRAVLDLLPTADAARRVPIPAGKLILGTNCGGSDGNSGITANPALGHAADLLVAQGGTVVLGETPEIYGAEHLLTRRAISREVGEKLVERIRWWEWYTGLFGARMDNNPSHGNKAGGLTTIYEKSLGAVAKGGTTALRDVVRYAEPVRSRGLVVMDTPGYDPVSVTGIVAGGAQVMVFTTGRGSVFGCRPAPCLKVSTNTPLYERMTDDMDFDAGPILRGESVAAAGERLFEAILRVASGEPTKSESQGVGDDEFVPWSIGPTL